MADVQLENGYTKIADEFLEALIRTNIPARDLRIMLLIIRKTWGFNKREEFIKLSEICKRTNITKGHVSTITKNLIKRCMIMVTIDGNHKAHKYRIIKDFDKWKPLPPKVTPLPPKVTVTAEGNQSLPPKVTTVTVEGNAPINKELKDTFIKDTSLTNRTESVRIFKKQFEIDETPGPNPLDNPEPEFNTNLFEIICKFLGTTSANIKFNDRTYCKNVIATNPEPEIQNSMKFITDNFEPKYRSVKMIEKYTNPDFRKVKPEKNSIEEMRQLLKKQGAFK